MAKQRLTANTVRGAKVPAGKSNLEIWDTDLPSFGLRVGRSGRKTFFIRYRENQQQVRLKIGNASLYTLAEARDIAREHFRNIEKGEYPKRLKAKPGRSLEPQNAADTSRDFHFSAVMADFVKIHCIGPNPERPNKRSWQYQQRVLERICEYLGDPDIRMVTRAQVQALLDDYAFEQHKGVMANRFLAHLKTFFRWCLKREILTASPVENIDKPQPEHVRQRTLSDDELIIIWSALEQTPYPYGPIMQLLILTSQRYGEISGLKWSMIDRQEKLLKLPITKNGQPHDVPLSEPALEIIHRLPRIVGPYCFGLNGQGPYTRNANAKRRLDILITQNFRELPRWTTHDFRRTAANGMQRLGTRPHIIERCLNHSIPKLEKTYQTYAYINEKREALDAWGAHVMDITAQTLPMAASR